MTPAASATWSDFTVLTLCAAAAQLDRAADAVSREVADLPLSHPRQIAAFRRVDPWTGSWHAIRLIVANLPATAEQAVQARAALLGDDPAAAVQFSMAQLTQSYAAARFGGVG